MKLSGVLAVLLSASIPSGTFAQSFSASRSRPPAAYGSGTSSPYGSVAGAAVLFPLDLSLSAPLLTPGLTPAPGVTPALTSPMALTASAIPDAAKPETIRAASASARPAAEQGHTSGEIAALRAAWVAHPSVEPVPGTEEYRAGMRLFDEAGEGLETTAGAPVVDGKPREHVRLKLDGGGTYLFKVREAAVPAAPATFSAAKTPEKPSSPWDMWTERLTKYSLVPYFFLQIPQVITNFANIVAGDFAKLAGLPWIGYSTGLLASFMLLSYFNAMKEKPSALVQVVGIMMNMVVLGQLAYVGFMPPAAFLAIAPLTAGGLALNYLNTRGKANPTLWKLWERGTALTALASIPPSILISFGAVLTWSQAVIVISSWTAGAAAFAAGLALVILDNQGKLKGRLKDIWTSLNAASATALYTLNPLIGLTWIYLHPTSIPGISATTNILNMAGAMLLLPRGLYLRKGIWIFGNAWAIGVGSWVALLVMTLYGALSAAVFWPLTAAVVGYLTFILRQNAKNPAPPAPEMRHDYATGKLRDIRGHKYGEDRYDIKLPGPVSTRERVVIDAAAVLFGLPWVVGGGPIPVGLYLLSASAALYLRRVWRRSRPQPKTATAKNVVFERDR